MFENKLNFNFKVNQQILKKISFIDSFRGKWDIIENKQNIYLKELKKIATVESIGSSTRIEGATLTDEDVKKLLADIKVTKFTTRDQQEVIGYYETLDTILESYQDIPLTENHIKQLHKILLNTDKDTAQCGEYKTANNTVVASYPDGSEKIIFKTTDPFMVQKEMSDVITWTNKNLGEDIHPLIIVSLFIYEFLSIHPFHDGNGRLSRLLTTMLLLQQGYNFIQYVSFEHIIEEQKKRYYQVLMNCQKNRYKENEIIDQWSLFFLECLETLIQKLEKKYDLFQEKGGYLNDRQKEILNFISNNHPVKISDIDKRFSEFPRNTIKKDLLYLVNENFIQKIGEKRGTVYIPTKNN